MCVAVLKPAGAKCPALSVLRDCWDANQDGAGVAVSERNSVLIRKGFMTFGDFEAWFTRESISRRTHQAVVFHFRIGTHGKNDAGNTHPFPVSSDPATLRRTCGRFRMAVAHNGTFSNEITLPGVSDTGQFMADCANAGGDPLKYWDDNKSVTGWSRLVVLKPGNGYDLRGSWHCVDGSGCLFSNLNWQRRAVYVAPKKTGRAFGAQGWYDDCWDWDDVSGRYVETKPAPEKKPDALSKYLGAEVKPATGIMTPGEVTAAGGVSAAGPEVPAEPEVPIGKLLVRITRTDPATGEKFVSFIHEGGRVDEPAVM